MKKIFFEIGLVIIFSLIYLLFPTVRIALIIAFSCLAIWIVPVQLFLSINLQNWLNELGGRFHKLTPDDRLMQIRETFKGLDHIDASKLRRFYIHVSVFHYVLMIFFALGFLTMGIFFLFLGVLFPGPNMAAISLVGFVVTSIVGYLVVNNVFPGSVKKNIDAVLFLFWSKDWRRKLFDGTEGEETSDSILRNFFSYWCVGKTREEKEINFRTFINDLNTASTNGQLFTIKDDGKILINEVAYAGSFNKSFSGFLKYCIEERKVLSSDILHNKKRHLLREVFALDNSKSLIFLEDSRMKAVSDDYVKVYRVK
ncbi:hypothetical protein SAMN06265348_10825 [Pedobacter westerhofensis]|uniref:Uncharacterized protein n=1 Tax=Pedobacter westerhofensis TaxID=425512 RepID=A0A521EEU4_9SPHI|nr:hypothetical protein [Pedobacter westerhofensis]SMO82449.1 hypothetical protein SAMN06265348_10825 [Pedobacter westerhofensis]